MKYYKYKTEITDLYIFEENSAIVAVQMEEASVKAMLSKADRKRRNSLRAGAMCVEPGDVKEAEALGFGGVDGDALCAGRAGLGVTSGDVSETEALGMTENAFEETALIRQAFEELTEYFMGLRKVFTVPLAPEGTEFQRKVWQALCDIPYGQTRCYSEIAEAIGNPKACRAIGAANKVNPIAIMIPCHRVITKSGALGGYGGMGPLVRVKGELLALEKKYSEKLCE